MLSNLRILVLAYIDQKKSVVESKKLHLFRFYAN